MTEEPICPECGGPLEKGYLQAPGVGILWTNDPNAKWMPVFSSKVEKLQEDWWGFPKLTKDKLPALRCHVCKLVIFIYSGGNPKGVK
jgi:Domain of unknown function (DUF6487)